MNDQPIQPLTWDGAGISTALEGHPLTDFYSEVIRLIHELAECVDDGVTRWRGEYRKEELAYAANPPWLHDDERWLIADNAQYDALELSGYPVNIRMAAQAIFYSLSSAAQYHGFGYYSSLAEAIRNHSMQNGETLHTQSEAGNDKPAQYVITDRYIYAMAASVEAWHAQQGLIKWLDDGLALLGKDFNLLSDMDHSELVDLIMKDPEIWKSIEAEDFTVSEWARLCPDQFSRWAGKYRTQWAISEADEREYAARCLGRSKRMLLLSDMADELTQATLDRLSLQGMQPVKARFERAAQQLSEARPKAAKSKREAAKAAHEEWLSAYDKLERADSLSTLSAAKIIAERQGGNVETIRKVLAKHRPLK